MESEKEHVDLESLTESDSSDTNVTVNIGNNRKLWIILISLTLGYLQK